MMHDLFSQPSDFDQGYQLEILEAHWATHEFHQEVQYRQEFEAYCQWYYDVAERHRQELKAMQGDINILGWFCRS